MSKLTPAIEAEVRLVVSCPPSEKWTAYVLIEALLSEVDELRERVIGYVKAYPAVFEALSLEQLLERELREGRDIYFTCPIADRAIADRFNCDTFEVDGFPAGRSSGPTPLAALKAAIEASGKDEP